MNRQNELTSLHGRRVTVLGLGRFGGGVAVTRFLAGQGARVTVTDLADESVLSDSLNAVADLTLEGVFLGEHPDAAFRDCEVVVVNPGIPPNADVWQRVPRVSLITSELEMFVHRCPAPVVAVTGSNGKSTTAALIHHLLMECGQRSWLGGNIGVSLLPHLGEMDANDYVVLEVSSFQLERLRQANFSPQIAVLTQFAPNHLDWHGAIDAYRTAKQVLFDRQTMQSLAVLPADADVNVPGCSPPAWRIRGRLQRFGSRDTGEDGVFAEDGSLLFRRPGIEDALRIPSCPGLPGVHNLENLAAASSVLWEVGGEPASIVNAASSFESLPHRLQQIAQTSSHSFVNDSVATTPESVIAALRTVAGPISIIAGGADKGVDLSSMAEVIAENTVGCVLIGQTSSQLFRLLQKAADGGFPVASAGGIVAAVDEAARQLATGGTVLLSPGCASYGMFRDYRDRGDQFTIAARKWAASG